MDAATAPPPPLADDNAIFLNSTVNSVYELIVAIPGSHLILTYVKNAYQDDPFRIILELFLVFFALKYMLSKKYKPQDNAVKLTEKEIDDLVEEWKPEPLVPPLSSLDKLNLEKAPLIIGGQSAKPKVAGHAKPLMNLASTNYLELQSSERIRQKAIDTLKVYGVGSCGPPGFYGTIDVHMDLERDLAKFLGTEQAIIYAQGFSTVSSVIPAFSKRGDLLVVDDGVSFSVQKGAQISRSNVRYFKHNDMQDLERVLDDIRVDDLVHKRKLTRRFIVTEGLFANHGDIAPLPKLIELKLVDHQRLSGLAYCFSASIPAMLAVSASEGLKYIQENPQMLRDLTDRARAFRQTLTHKSLENLIEMSSPDLHSPAPFFHIRINPTFLKSRSRDGHEFSREDEERLLQDVVDECAAQGVLLTRAKYVYEQERNCPRPSIKVYVTIGLSKKENDKAAGVVKSGIVKVFGKWKK
ncbi:serine palmitoyl transferase subunit [Lichtheimia corymbifera JMRC:FSU:9682]|uniref:serine C-palmitoyltransferase n=1 Tax=Lichtheimia corymbifera JMRC:FSU:9682 TaxID=1263082 RepID=A0A068S7M0_9FUNG|nr:serine palmitoyl transferase subunit [Lichtheimia corymbifera JMRC:FSU:9682]